MPKSPHYESAIHHFLLAAKRMAEVERLYHPANYEQWGKFILSFTFAKIDSSTIQVRWSYPKHQTDTFSIKNIVYYTRGDTKDTAQDLKSKGEVFHGDSIQTKNDQLFFSFVAQMAKKAGFRIHPRNKPDYLYGNRSIYGYTDEEHLSDDWAHSTDVTSIDVVKMNESPTSPEMRYITKRLGNIRGKRIVDLGCGLGEAAVYFAKKGARVTAVDLSAEMLGIARKLARRNHVRIRTILASVEHLPFKKNEVFDIFYAGNLFHHVDIPLSMKSIQSHMHKSSILVCWEPARYNPVINIYRNMATNVRSFGERPLGLSDIRFMKGHFKKSSVQWFWFTTLILFVYMYVVERRNPNTERYWKSIVKEGYRRAWIYQPLAKLDRALLSLFPFLKPLCWNVVLYLAKPKLPT